jgi:hypothetical protein
MKIIKRNSDNVVIYAGEALTLDSRASNGEWVDANASTATHTLIDGVTLPADFMGGQHTFDGAWAYTVAGQAAADSVLAAKKSAWFKAIDAAAIAVYDRPTTLGDEYKGREAEAISYQASGYTGTVPPRIEGFATPAGLTAQAATDLILTQAAKLRGALASIADLRMQKYAVNRAATEGDALAVYIQAMTSIAAIAAALG